MRLPGTLQISRLDPKGVEPLIFRLLDGCFDLLSYESTREGAGRAFKQKSRLLEIFVVSE